LFRRETTCNTFENIRKYLERILSPLQWNRNAMLRIPRPFLLLASLLIVTAARAEPTDPPIHGVGSVVFTPAARPHLPNLDPPPNENRDLRGNRRYGIGYDARHGIDADAKEYRGSRMEGFERSQQPPSGTGGNAGAGRGGHGR
jgi:hypothetical protein